MPLACLGVLQGYLLKGSRPSSLPKNEDHMWHERLVGTHMLQTTPKLGMSNMRVLAYCVLAQEHVHGCSGRTFAQPQPHQWQEVLPPVLTRPRILVLLPRRLGPQSCYLNPGVSRGLVVTGPTAQAAPDERTPVEINP